MEFHLIFTIYEVELAKIVFNKNLVKCGKKLDFPKIS